MGDGPAFGGSEVADRGAEGPVGAAQIDAGDGGLRALSVADLAGGRPAGLPEAVAGGVGAGLWGAGVGGNAPSAAESVAQRGRSEGGVGRGETGWRGERYDRGAKGGDDGSGPVGEE